MRTSHNKNKGNSGSNSPLAWWSVMAGGVAAPLQQVRDKKASEAAIVQCRFLHQSQQSQWRCFGPPWRTYAMRLVDQPLAKIIIYTHNTRENQTLNLLASRHAQGRGHPERQVSVFCCRTKGRVMSNTVRSIGKELRLHGFHSVCRRVKVAEKSVQARWEVVQRKRGEARKHV